MDTKRLKGIPEPTLRRMPFYLKFLRTLKQQGQVKVSCTTIAEEFQYDPTQVRKDMAMTGVVGVARIGFDIEDLIDAVERFLGWRNHSDAVLVGAGNFGRALAGYGPFRRHGLNFVAAFDIDPDKAGTPLAGIKVFPMDRLASLVDRMRVPLGVLTVPAPEAQGCAELMVEAGIQGIWNFCPVRLKLPQTVLVEDVVLSASLAVLTSKLKRRQGARNDGT